MGRLGPLTGSNAKGGYSAIVLKDGSTVWAEDNYGRTIAEGEAGIDDASVIQSALDADGKILIITAGDYTVNTPITISGWKLIFGFGWYTKLIAGATVDYIFQIKKPSERVGNVSIENLMINGNDKATCCIQVDSAKFVYLNKLNIANSETGIHITSNEYAYSEFIKVDHCNICCKVKDGIVVDKGSAGIVTDVAIRDCSITELTGWGVKLVDTQKCIVEKTHIGNNSTDFSGGVLITSDGNIYDCANIVRDLTVENQVTGGTAIGVKIELTGGTYKSYAHVIDGLLIVPPGRTFVELSNLSATGLLRDIEIRELRNIGTTSQVIIGDGCEMVRVWLDAEPFSDSIIVNNGIATKINNLAVEDAGIGNFPTSTKWDVGETVINTSDNTVWIKKPDGTWKKIVSNQNSGTVTFSGDGNTAQFTIAHELVTEPTKVLVTPRSNDAAGDFYVTSDDTNIYVNYLSAPPSGTDNVVLSWQAEV